MQRGQDLYLDLALKICYPYTLPCNLGNLSLLLPFSGAINKELRSSQNSPQHSKHL